MHGRVQKGRKKHVYTIPYSISSIQSHLSTTFHRLNPKLRTKIILKRTQHVHLQSMVEYTGNINKVTQITTNFNVCKL